MPERNYPNRLNCYVCGETDHLAKMCPRKINNNDKRSNLIECTNEDLLEIDEYISDKESRVIKIRRPFVFK